MFTENYNQINSIAACRSLIRVLKRQISALENRAEKLKVRRRRIPVDPVELNDIMKAAKAILQEPKYPEKKSWLIRQYCRKYTLRAEHLEACIGFETIRQGREQSKHRKRTTRIMLSKGKKQKDIARALGLSTGRISQIVTEIRNG